MKYQIEFAIGSTIASVSAIRKETLEINIGEYSRGSGLRGAIFFDGRQKSQLSIQKKHYKFLYLKRLIKKPQLTVEVKV